MIIKTLKVLTFRNIEDLSIDFKEKINLIIGKNGSGKTNLLNAIYYLSYGNTFNNIKESELPKFGETSFYLNGLFFYNDFNKNIKIEIIYKEKRKIISINGKPIQSQKELIGIVPVIFFNFRTKDIILKEPELRRNFLDTHISIIDKDYKNIISEYSDILQSKNSTLKKLKEDRGNFYLEILLDSLNEKLFEKGYIIQEKRDNFIKKISNELKNFYLKNVEIFYEPKLISIQELNKIKNEEIDRGYGLIGPHLDDIIFLYKGCEIKNLFSLGEVEELSLYLILSLYNVIYNELNKKPIILIDDLFETIDKEKIENLIEILYNFNQVIITSFSEEIVPVELKVGGSTFFLEKGVYWMLERLSQILDRFLEERDIKKKIYEKEIILNWKNYVGNLISTHIFPKNIRNGVLYVYSDHPTWSENFINLFPEIKKKINDSFGLEIIKDLKVYLMRKENGRKK